MQPTRRPSDCPICTVAFRISLHEPEAAGQRIESHPLPESLNSAGPPSPPLIQAEHATAVRVASVRSDPPG